MAAIRSNSSNAAIVPVHPSVRQLLATGMRMRPKDMSRIKLDREHYEGLQRIALDIFVDCTNVGVPFQEALASVYLSGLEHGHELTKEQE